MGAPFGVVKFLPGCGARPMVRRRAGRCISQTGIHRAASASVRGDDRRDPEKPGTFLAVAFPSDQVRILPYSAEWCAI
jgi:hypothetical protein